MNSPHQTNHSTVLVIPTVVPLDTVAPIPANFLPKLLERYDVILEEAIQEAEEEVREYLHSKHKLQQAQNRLKDWQNYTPTCIEQDLQILGGMRQSSQTWSLFRTLFFESDLCQKPEFRLVHLLRLYKNHFEKFTSGLGCFAQKFLRNWVKHHPNELTDLRQLILLMQHEDISPKELIYWILPAYATPPIKLNDTFGMVIWPFFAEHDEYLQEVFSSADLEKKGRVELGVGMLVVAQFPVIPEKYLQVIYQYALSTHKFYAPLARQILGRYGVVLERITFALTSSKLDERIIAANWIAELNLSEAIQPLEQALKKEKKETAIATMLSALHKLGVDLGAYLSPSKLLQEAMQGLSKAIPKGLEWFPFDALPHLNWHNGQPVENQIIKWWVVLACKLKQPEGHPLLDLYMQQLHPNSQKLLGFYILQLFIQQDVCTHSDEAAHAYAKTHQNSAFTYAQQYGEYTGVYYETLDDAYHASFEEKKREYIGSVIGEKGILALTICIEPIKAVQLLKSYMKEHHTRRAQIEAILLALANSNDPVIVQFLLSLARRYRTESIQEKARQLVNVIAERNHWTHDELADRTIPTAGFENNGQQVLQYGSRNLVLSLDRHFKIVLQNEDSKVLKALPSPRQNDDEELIKQAKTAFNNSKKELKQVLDLQAARLYESMCIHRLWSASEWRQYYFEHPIMNRLLQQLVWQIQEGDQQCWVRPTAELELLDINDEVHTLNDTATVCIAHMSQISIEQAKAWRKHFKTEKITPLFEQFNQPTHVVTDEERNGNKLSYHKGWLIDAFTLRSILTKRGYQRGPAADGGVFTYYYKAISSLNLNLLIEFSGNGLPEENNTVALYSLIFFSANKPEYAEQENHFNLANIPESLISEAMLDYESVAAKGSFDPEWKNKIR